MTVKVSLRSHNHLLHCCCSLLSVHLVDGGEWSATSCGLHEAALAGVGGGHSAAHQLRQGLPPQGMGGPCAARRDNRCHHHHQCFQPPGRGWRRRLGETLLGDGTSSSRVHRRCCSWSDSEACAQGESVSRTGCHPWHRRLCVPTK